MTNSMTSLLDMCYGSPVTFSAAFGTADAKRVIGGTSAWRQHLSYNQEPKT